MDTLHKNIQSKRDEITEIFDEYRAKLDNIIKKLNENPSRPVDDESNDSIENSCKKLAEIVIEKEQETSNILDEVKRQFNNKEASDTNNELMSRVRQAKTISDEGDND